ncbi:MAG TPA: DsrE family protein [Dehalococcoidia bacterium]|nr:DsrE family protein [Dehalococcoidia bacterium]
MAERKRIVYLLTSGTDTPERLYAPFILATTAAAMGQEPTIYAFIKGITAFKKGEAEKVKIGAFPSLKEVMDQARQAGVRFLVCEQSCMLLGLDRGDFVEGAEVVGAATLNDVVLSADAVISV